MLECTVMWISKLLVSLNRARNHLPCYLCSPDMYAKLSDLLNHSIANKNHNCHLQSLWISLQWLLLIRFFFFFLSTAAQYGNGTYFAVNASYSANDTYSKPDANGKKHMYLARVLVGQYSQGTQGAITPAAKNVGNTVDLFDSSTDNVNNPSMFIIFNDIQAYPEYLITFTRWPFWLQPWLHVS